MQNPDDPYLRRLTTFGVYSFDGFRACELWEGDITKLPMSVDMLVISALPGDYEPTDTSVIGALAKVGVDVESLSCMPDLDLRATPLRCWVSRALEHPIIELSGEEGSAEDSRGAPRFGRILCVEFEDDSIEMIDQMIASVFGVLAMLDRKVMGGGPVRVLAMPAIGTGDLGADLTSVVDRIIPACRAALERSGFLKQIALVAYDEKAAKRFRAAIEAHEGRVRVPLNTERLMACRRDVAEKAGVLSRKVSLSSEARQTLEDVHRLLLWNDAGNFEIATAGRKVAELAVQDVLRFGGKKKGGSLMEDINKTSECNVAGWIQSYLHTLRVFGNSEVHTMKDGHSPASIDERDVELWCMGLWRVIDFWELILERNDEFRTS